MKYSYPGDGYYYIICDICGKKLRAKDAVYIADKFNLHSKLLVCPQDADKTNPQQYLKTRIDKELTNPKIVRSEGTDTYMYIDTVAQIESGDVSDPTGRTASAPLGLTILSATASSVELIWQGPEDSGSGAISGYKIERESPIGGGFVTLTATTSSVARYYADTSVSASTQYNYQVSAVNKDGTGTASAAASCTTGAS